MPNTHNGASGAIEPGIDSVYKIPFSVLEKPTNGIRAKVGQLHHACQAAVHKQRRFDDVVDAGPPGSLTMKPLHHGGESLRYGRIVVLHD
jgi:hypothetical protein